MLYLFLLLCQSQHLVSVLLDVSAAADVNPEVTTIGGFHNELVKVGVA